MRIQLIDAYHPQNQKIERFLVSEKLKLGRITGGLQWPTLTDPGYAVIIGEDWQMDETIQMRHMYVLAEKESLKIDELLKWCEIEEIRTPKEIQFYWHTDNRNRPCMEFVWQIRKQSRERGKYGTLSIVPAPYVDHPEGKPFLVQNLLKYLSTEPSSLHIADNSPLRGKLAATKDEPCNAVLALGYAVSALATWPTTGKF